jgi:hypothetical protein
MLTISTTIKIILIKILFILNVDRLFLFSDHFKLESFLNKLERNEKDSESSKKVRWGYQLKKGAVHVTMSSKW